MASTSPTRIDTDVVESARHVAEIMNRSASQQISHWARIGREVEAAASTSPRAITNVLTGPGAYDDLGAEEQAVVRATWAEAISLRISELDLRRRFLAEGRSFAELDDDGHVVRRSPARA